MVVGFGRPFRPESPAGREGSLNWSDLPESKRSSLALLKTHAK
jgi:hypothetical protein